MKRGCGRKWEEEGNERGKEIYGMQEGQWNIMKN